MSVKENQPKFSMKTVCVELLRGDQKRCDHVLVPGLYSNQELCFMGILAGSEGIGGHVREQLVDFLLGEGIPERAEIDMNSLPFSYATGQDGESSCMIEDDGGVLRFHVPHIEPKDGGIEFVRGDYRNTRVAVFDAGTYLFARKANDAHEARAMMRERVLEKTVDVEPQIPTRRRRRM